MAASDNNTLTTNFTAEIGDVLAKLSGMLKGIMDLAASSAPFATAMGVSDGALKLLESTLSKVQGSVTSFATALKNAGTDTETLGKVVKTAVDGVNSVAESLTKTTSKSEQYKDALKILTAEAGDNKTMLAGMKKELNDLDKAHNAYAAGQPDKAFKDTYNAVSLASDAVTNYTMKGNLLTQSTANVTKGHQELNKEFDLGEFKTSSLGKAFAISASKGEAFFQALVKGGDAFGINTPKIDSFIASLFSVNKHLESIPKSSLNGKNALAELGDSTRLSQLAMGLMSGELLKVKDGFQIASGKMTESGTVMGENAVIAASLFNSHKNLGAGLNDYISIQGKNTTAIREGANRLLEYEKAVNQTKASMTNIAVASTTAAGGYSIYTKTADNATAGTNKLNSELNAFTGVAYSTSQVAKVVSGSFEVTAASVANLSRETLASSPVTEALANKYNGVSEGLKKVSEYGDIYTKSLQMTLDAQTKDTASIDRAVAAHLKYATTAETMISQHRALSDSLIQNWNSTTQYNGALIAQGAYTDVVNKAHESFANTLRSQESIGAGVAQTHKNLSEELLNLSDKTNGANVVTERMRAIQGSLIPMVEEHRAKITELNNQIITNEISTKAGFEAYGKYRQGLVDAARAVEEAKKAQEEHNKSLEQVPGFFSRITSSIMETVQSFAVYQIASAIISTFIGSITALISTTAELDQILHSLKAITNSTSVEMAGMSETIKNSAASSIYSIGEIGKSLTLMAQAGLTAGESVNTLKATVNLATGTLETLENTADLMTSTMTSYNISTIEAARVSDILAIACNNSKLSIDKLRTSLNYVGVIAAQSGLSLEETSASLMVLADRGMKASTVGTGFRQVLDKLIAPNEKLREAYQSHGIALDKISPLTAGYEEALKNLSLALYDSDTKTVNTAKAFELFGIRGAQAAAILIQSYTSGEWKDAMNSFNESGTAAKMAAEQLQGLEGMWSNLKAKVSALLVTLGEGGLVAVLKEVVRILSIFVEGFLDVTKTIDSSNLFIKFLTGSIASLIIVFSVASIAITSWTTATTFASISGSFLNTVVLGLKKSFDLLTVTMMKNPFVLWAVGITSLIALAITYKDKLQDIIEGHNKLALESEQAANVLTLFSKVLSDSKDNSEGYTKNVNRLKSEFPELNNQLMDVAETTDIANLSFQELSDAMSELKDIKLAGALNESVEALMNMNPPTVKVIDSFQGLMSTFWDMATKSNVTTKVFSENLKAVAANAIAIGNTYVGSYKEQKEVAIECLNQEIKLHEELGKYRQEITDLIIKSIDKQEQREIQNTFATVSMTKKMSAVWGELSASQRADIQSVVEEEGKAVEKFSKFADDKKIKIEEKEAEIYAIKLKMQIKSLNLLSESTKKEYETQDEKYAREEGLLEKKEALVHNALLAEEEEYKKNYESKYKSYDEYLSLTKIHLSNIATLQAAHDKVLREQANLVFEQQKKILADYLVEVKNSTTLQATLLQAFELEKMQIAEKGSEVALEAKRFEIEQVQRLMDAEIAANGLRAESLVGYNSKMKVLLQEELVLRTDTINKILEQGKYWLDRSNEFQDQSLAYIKDIYTQKEAIVNKSYEKESYALKNALTEKMNQISKANQNELIADNLKNIEKLKYYEKEILLAKKAFEDKKILIEQEYSQLKEVTATKLAINEKYNDAVKNLYAKSAVDRVAIENQITTQEVSSNEAKYAEFARIQQEYRNSVKGLYEDTSTYLSTAEKTSLAEHIKKLNDQLIADKQYQLSWEGINADITASYAKETEIAKTEGSNRVKNRIQQQAEEGLSVNAQIDKYKIAYVKETELTKAQLREQGIAYVTFGNEVYKVITDKTAAIEKGLRDETKLHRDATTKIIELSSEEVKVQIKNYEELIPKIKTQLDAEIALHKSTVEAIEKLRMDSIASSMNFEELRRKTLQSTMTEEKKYYDDVTAFEKALAKVQETGLKLHYDDAMSKLTSLTTGEIKSGNTIILSAQQTAQKKIKFINDMEAVDKSVKAAEKKRLEDLDAQLTKSIETNTKALESFSLQLKEFQNMEINIKTEKVTESTAKIKEELDNVITKLKSIEGEAPIKLNIEDVKTKLSDATNLIDGLIKKLNDTPMPPIVVKIEGADGVPLKDFLGLAKAGIDFVFNQIKSEPKVVPVSFTGNTGIEDVPLVKAVEDVKTQVTKLGTDLKDEKNTPVVPVQIKGKVGETEESLPKAIVATETAVVDLKTSLAQEEKTPVSITVFKTQTEEGKVSLFKEGMDWIKATFQALLDLINTPSEHIVNIKIVGAELIEKLKEPTFSTHTVTVVTVDGGSSSSDEDEDAGNQRTGGYISARVGGFIQHLRRGGAFTGKLPGYGGGDIVNAKLEPGEFVLRKEAVKNIGVDALRQWNNLNSSAMKSLNPQSGSTKTDSLFTGQLHTVNLNIGDQSHRVYAEPNVLNSLTSSLRRARLMKA